MTPEQLISGFKIKQTHIFHCSILLFIFLTVKNSKNRYNSWDYFYELLYFN
jgi:hypothetical protein